METDQHDVVEKRHIAIDPHICGGKPCIKGTRVRVWDIHVWHDLQGMAPEEIVAEFPQVTVADVHAALVYYHDHRVILEERDRQAQQFVEELEGKYVSKLNGRLGKGASDDSISS